MELSQKLKELRKKQGLTQLELAERLFVSRQAISGWEAGTSRPSTENLQSLSKLYNVPLEMLLDDAEAAGPEPEKIPEEERPEKEKHEPGPDKARRKDDKKKKRLVGSNPKPVIHKTLKSVFCRLPSLRWELT